MAVGVVGALRIFFRLTLTILFTRGGAARVKNLKNSYTQGHVVSILLFDPLLVIPVALQIAIARGKLMSKKSTIKIIFCKITLNLLA